jgi:hypothetical protein
MHLSGRDHLSCKLLRYLEDVEDSERQPAEGEDSAHQDEQDAGSVTNRSLTLFFISLVNRDEHGLTTWALQHIFQLNSCVHICSNRKIFGDF